MKITAVRTFLLERLLLVRVETDLGLHGVGEATWFGRELTALKVYPFEAVKTVDSIGPIMRAARRVAAIREAVGWEVDICVDCHGRLSPTMAVIAEEELRPLRPLFMEEPVLPDAITS